MIRHFQVGSHLMPWYPMTSYPAHSQHPNPRADAVVRSNEIKRQRSTMGTRLRLTPTTNELFEPRSEKHRHSYPPGGSYIISPTASLLCGTPFFVSTYFASSSRVRPGGAPRQSDAPPTIRARQKKKRSNHKNNPFTSKRPPTFISDAVAHSGIICHGLLCHTRNNSVHPRAHIGVTTRLNSGTPV